VLKTALVTGAGGGLGRGIALGLAEDGWDVAVNDLPGVASAEETATAVRALGRRAWVVAADVGDGRQVRAMFERLDEQANGLDLLVNNAGVQTWAPLIDLREEDWDRTIRTNLKGTFLCTQQAARRMKGRGGVIINIGSGANQAPFPNLSDYCASRGGIEMFTKVAAVELGADRIRVNCVAPGCIEIERTRREDPQYAEKWGALTPLRRIGTPADVARVVAFLASDRAAFVTGQTVYVDGGLWSQVPWAYPANSQEGRS
jgi:NAD(P)-dependent dehydrogenase (short-subunit alcohol dehydrogenase family)